MNTTGKTYWVYILASQKNGTLYVGATNSPHLSLRGAAGDAAIHLPLHGAPSRRFTSINTTRKAYWIYIVARHRNGSRYVDVTDISPLSLRGAAGDVAIHLPLHGAPSRRFTSMK